MTGQWALTCGKQSYCWMVQKENDKAAEFEQEQTYVPKLPSLIIFYHCLSKWDWGLHQNTLAMSGYCFWREYNCSHYNFICILLLVGATGKFIPLRKWTDASSNTHFRFLLTSSGSAKLQGSKLGSGDAWLHLQSPTLAEEGLLALSTCTWWHEGPTRISLIPRESEHTSD